MKSELKVFIFVLIVNLLFSHLVGDDNVNRIFYSNAIANGTLFLDNYHTFIGDLTKWKEHYISTKSPGISFLLSPISFIFENILPISHSSTFIPENLHYKKLLVLELSLSIKLSSLIALFFFSALPGALIVLLLFKYTRNIYVALSIYFSSLLFPYSSTLFSYTFSIFLILFAFIRKHKLISPLLLGFSVLVEFTSIFLVLIILFYLRNKIKIRYFFIGLLPMIVYLLVFPSLLFYFLNLTNISYLNPSIFLKFSTNYQSFIIEKTSQTLANILFLLFSPYRGLFFYFPLFIIFILYFRIFKDTEKKIAVLSFFIYLLFNSILWYWWGFLSFGPRHMIYSLPFILLAISSGWKKINKKLFYLLTLISFIITFSSFTYWEGAKKIKMWGKDFYSTGIYKKGEVLLSDETELVLFSPIAEHYLKSLIENGPRSKLIESLFTERPLDLRYLLPEDRDFITSIYPYPHYFSIFILVLLFMVFFSSELKKRKIILLLLFGMIVAIFIYNLHYFWVLDFFKEVNKLELKFGFYPRDPAGNLFIYKKGTIYVFSTDDKEKLLSLELMSFHEDRKVTLILNGEKIRELNVSKDYDTIISLPVRFKKGKNTLSILSDKCLRPIELNASNDKRCLSLAFKSINISEIIADQLVFSEGWYMKTKEDDYRWGSDSVKLLYVSRENKTVTFYFDILPIYNETTIVEFYLNGELKNIFEISKGGYMVYTLPQKIREGINYLEFKVPRGCLIIDEILHNGDKRCIAMTLRGIKVVEE